jgi:hypothetical protein
MNSDFRFAIEYANNEFNGTAYKNNAYNGLSLIAMLNKLTINDVTDNNTYEGYSIIEIVMHLAYCKYFVNEKIGNKQGYPYPYYKGVEGFYTPLNLDDNIYREIIEYLVVVHQGAMDSINGLEKKDYDKWINEWGMTHKEAAIWLCNHDTYHIAQIRNMGIQVLKKNKITMEEISINSN